MPLPITKFLRQRFVQFQTAVMSSHAKCSTVKMPAIYVASKIPKLHEKLLAVVPQGVEVKSMPIEDSQLKSEKEWPTEKTLNFLKESEVLLCDPGVLVETYDKLTDLRWAHCTWAGVENLVAAVDKKKVLPKFLVTRHGGPAFARLMAEYVLCQIMSFEKHVHYFYECQHAKIWPSDDMIKRLDCRSLNELVVCVLGIGNMGLGVAKLLKAVGCKVLGYSRSHRSADAREYEYFDKISTDLADLLPDCDYLCNTLPSTPKTKGLLDSGVLEMCKKAPVFINVGRGDIIHEDTVCEVFRKKWISGAVLDVFNEEPLPPSSELWKLSPRVIVTPHVAAISQATHVLKEFLKNYKLFTENKQLNSTVDWSAGY